MANVSVANSTLTKPLANRISTICERKHMVSTTTDDSEGVGSEIDASKADLFDHRKQTAVMHPNSP